MRYPVGSMGKTNISLLFLKALIGLTVISFLVPAFFVEYLDLSTTTRVRGLRRTAGPSFSPDPSLLNKRILFEVTTVGMAQFHFLQELLDGVRDICEAGAYVALHIVTADCDYDAENNACHEDNQELEEARRATPNYPNAILSLLNEKLNCRNAFGSIETTVHIKNPSWGSYMVGHHRKIFYDNIDNDFDVFIHVEEDELIRPTHVSSFLRESERIRKMVGDERFPDYLVGFMRFENDAESGLRVIWEFEEWDDDFKTYVVNHTGLDHQYFSAPLFRHQGMFMATEDHLRNWVTRGPECHFDVVNQDHGYHRERIGGGLDIYDWRICNVTQLIPLDSAEDFLIHHLPDENHFRDDFTMVSTETLHQWRMDALAAFHPRSEKREYKGIRMFVDEKDPRMRFDYDTSEYDSFVARGGRLEAKTENKPVYVETV